MYCSSVSKIIALLLLGAVLVADALAVTLGGLVDFTPGKEWKQVDIGRPRPLPTIVLVPADGGNTELLITLVPNEVAQVSDRDSLKKFHRVASTPFLNSPDQVPETTELKVNGGLGVYATFIDPALVGKPAKRGSYKVAIPIVAWLRPDAVFHATLFADSTEGNEVREGLQIVESAKLVSASTDSPNTASTQATDQPPSLRGIDAVLTLPDTNFKPTGALKADDPGYFSYANDRAVNLSGWLDNAGNYPGFKPFWQHEKAALEKGTGWKVRDERIKKIGLWDVVSYTTKVEDLVQYHLRACRVERNTWADLHLSIVASHGKTADLERVLEEVRLTRM